MGLAAKLHFLTLVLQSGIATGCSVLVAQYLGAKDLANSRSILAAALWTGLGFSLPFFLACAFGARQWMPLINPDAPGGGPRGRVYDHYRACPAVHPADCDLRRRTARPGANRPADAGRHGVHPHQLRPLTMG